MPGHNLTLTGRIKRPSFAQVCEWVKQAWDYIRPEIAVKSFKKCGISNALNGTTMIVRTENEYQSFNNEDDKFFGFEDE